MIKTPFGRRLNSRRVREAAKRRQARLHARKQQRDKRTFDQSAIDPTVLTFVDCLPTLPLEAHCRRPQFPLFPTKRASVTLVSAALQLSKEVASESCIHTKLPQIMPAAPAPSRIPSEVTVEVPEPVERPQAPDEDTDRYLAPLFTPSVGNLTDVTTTEGDSATFSRLRGLFSSTTASSITSLGLNTLFDLGDRHSLTAMTSNTLLPASTSSDDCLTERQRVIQSPTLSQYLAADGIQRSLSLSSYVHAVDALYTRYRRTLMRLELLESEIEAALRLTQ